MTTPTSGPWRAKAIGSFNEPGYAVFREDRSKPGVHTRRLDYKGCFTEADARLIAAAPDLLDVARHILAPDIADLFSPEYVQRVLAAIEKAEGKS